MAWATHHIEKLKRGETVSFRPRGHSMSGKIASGDLCKVAGAQYLHLIKVRQGDRFQIGNNLGRINGWIGPGAVFGRCIRVEK